MLRQVCEIGWVLSNGAISLCNDYPLPYPGKCFSQRNQQFEGHQLSLVYAS